MTSQPTTLRISNRKYPQRKCMQCQKPFIPHDYRQKYCCKQHKIDASNDRRRNENMTRFLNERKLRIIEKTLEMLSVRMEKFKIKTITTRDLYLAGVDRLDILVERGQTDNNVLVHWFYDYGIQTINKEASEFRILKR